MKNLFFGVLAIIGAALLTIPSATAKESALSANEIRQLIVGNTLNFWNQRTDTRIYMFFHENGLYEVAVRKDVFGRVVRRYFGYKSWALKADGDGAGVLCRETSIGELCHRILRANNSNSDNEFLLQTTNMGKLSTALKWEEGDHLPRT